MSTTDTSTIAGIVIAVVNGSTNTSNSSNSSNNPRFRTSDDGFNLLELITSPIVCLVGIVLNLLTVGTFLSRPLKQISCCLYLATRSFAVFVFLVSVLLALTPLMNTKVICELTVFLSYICPFISVWMVVIISIENFIRISHPARVGKICTPKVAKCVIAAFVTVGLMVYNIPLWTSGVIGGKCYVLAEFYQVVLVLNHIDVALTLFCPFVMMLIVVPLVGLTAVTAYQRKKRLNSRPDSTSRHRPQSADVKSSPESRVTRLLFAVSVVFLLLHTPFHSIRIKVFIMALTGAVPSSADLVTMNVFRLIYNLDTCASCVAYLVFGDNFRRIFCNKYFSRCQATPPEPGHTETTYVPTNVNSLASRDGVNEESVLNVKLLSEDGV